MRVETLGHLVQCPDLLAQAFAHLVDTLLAGLAGIEQVRPVVEPQFNQLFGHFRMPLQGQYLLAPGEGLIVAPAAAQQGLSTFR